MKGLVLGVRDLIYPSRQYFFSDILPRPFFALRYTTSSCSSFQGQPAVVYIGFGFSFVLLNLAACQCSILAPHPHALPFPAALVKSLSLALPFFSLA
jgi:hypothetical protein